MASRDNALFNVPRASHFSVLMSEDEEDAQVDSGAVVESSQPVPVEGPATEEAPKTTDQNPHDDWSCVSRKTYQKKTNKAVQNGIPRTNGSVAGSGRRTHAAPVAVEQFTPELTLEIFNFPSAWRTSDIRKFLSPFEGQYRLKWQNDTSCWVHFEEASIASRALLELQNEEASLRVFGPENVLPVVPKAEQSPAAETTIEVFGFPATWRAVELNKLLATWNGQYRLKWRNDASCFVIFDSAELLEAARPVLAGEAVLKIRPYSSLH